ncbi:hypothetical protein [Paracoccus tibetensis]|uniref:Holin-X, holin superfamily III n=1 Tax=Paracoccus tibetensis TaxID=336292 RepID=A0A1G5GMN9_9RHOB|nr:hypothetical protein [Paracoccus tibetensis]SCY52846.1 hypothetical protein SAMN05660710_01845 [Paracoccus tibetensis]
MRDDVMVWMGRLVAGLFVLGVMAVVATVAVMVARAEGIPPMPILVGIVALVILVLLAGACLAMISLAASARRGVQALERMAGQAPVMLEEEAEEADAPVPAAEAAAPVQGPFRAPGLREAAMAAPARPARPAGRVLVAER